MSVVASGGAPPYSFCWDVEPDGHRDASVPDPSFTLTRTGVYQPFVVVIDAQGNGQYIGTPPTGSPRRGGSRP
jgi:hypothetical protein